MVDCRIVLREYADSPASDPTAREESCQNNPTNPREKKPIKFRFTKRRYVPLLNFL